MQNRGGGHEGQGAVGAELGGGPAGFEVPGDGYHVVGASNDRTTGIDGSRGSRRATYTFCAHISGELGSGRGLGSALRVKVSLDASSSWTLEEPLVVIERAESSILCLTPAFVSSAVL